jgi:hypothetical protein
MTKEQIFISESCGYVVCKAAESAKIICDDLNANNFIISAVIKGILDSDILPNGKLDNIEQEWVNHISTKPIVEGTIDFVNTCFEDIEPEDVIIKGIKLSLKLAEEVIKEAGKEKEYASKLKTAYKALKKAEKTKRNKTKKSGKLYLITQIAKKLGLHIKDNQ